MSHRPRARGQTLVLFALTLLLLVLMVCFTLSVGTKIHEKIELQTMTDTAAYSNAVASARAMNAIAVLNRTHISLMVAMSGVQSLISWTGLHRGALNSSMRSFEHIRDQYNQDADDYCNPLSGSYSPSRCSCSNQAAADAQKVVDELKKEQDRINALWKSLDTAAGNQAIAIQSKNVTIRNHQRAIRNDLLLQGVFDGQKMTKTVVDQAKPAYAGTDELVVPTAKVPDKNFKEIGGAVREENEQMLHHLHATMGARGYQFVTGRGVKAKTPIESQLNSIIQRGYANASLAMGDVLGSGYFDSPPTHAAANPTGVHAWADDHAAGVGETSSLTPESPCDVHSDNTAHHPGAPSSPTAAQIPGDLKSWVRSTDKQDTDQDEEHGWTLQKAFNQDDLEDQLEAHTMAECVECPGLWPYFVDYNESNLTDPTNYFAQPKVYSLVQRDYNRRPTSPDPWNLLFRFRFARGGNGVGHDNRGLATTGGIDISQQQTIASGMVYYHRQGFWQEPPNLMNPFWRATLVHTDSGDVKEILTGVPLDTYTQLESKGFKGQ